MKNNLRKEDLIHGGIYKVNCSENFQWLTKFNKFSKEQYFSVIIYNNKNTANYAYLHPKFTDSVWNNIQYPTNKELAYYKDYENRYKLGKCTIMFRDFKFEEEPIYDIW